MDSESPAAIEEIVRLPKRRRTALLCAAYYQCCDSQRSDANRAEDRQDPRQYACLEEDCDKRFTDASQRKRHWADVHDLGVTWHPCTQEDCQQRFKRSHILKKHLANVHLLGVKWHPCTQEGCKQRFKNSHNLKTHLAHVHDLGVTWHPCTQEGCQERFKRSGVLKRHLADVHNLGVKWHSCTQEGCQERFKQVGNLKQHLAFVHDIGPHTCDYCCCNRTSRIPYDDSNAGSVHICRKCFRTVTGKNSRVEQLWSDYVDAELGTEGLLGSDTSLRSLGGCSRLRPDKLYLRDDEVEVDECDEYQHVRWGNRGYQCEERRLSEIYDEPGICGRNLTIIRWNPHSYSLASGVTKRASRAERLRLFLALKRAIRSRPTSALRSKIEVFYMFYDRDNSNICKNMPFR